MTQESVSSRGGSQAVRAARRDEAALLGELFADALLYERNGFRVVGELQALGHGPTLWRMWREPLPRA